MLDARTDPERLAALLGGLDAGTASELLGSRRLNDRLTGLVLDRLGLPGADEASAPPEWASFAELSGHDLVRLGRFAGAVWHARRLPHLVRRDDLEPLLQQIGEDAYGFGLRHLARGVEPPAAIPGWDLADQVAGDGQRCLEAWLSDAPARIGARLRLRLPTWMTPTGTFSGERARLAADLVAFAANEAFRS